MSFDFESMRGSSSQMSKPNLFENTTLEVARGRIRKSYAKCGNWDTGCISRRPYGQQVVWCFANM